MDIMEIARAFVGEEKTLEAVEAYTVALHRFLGKEPEAELEAALYLLRFGEDYKLPYTCLYYLYQRGFAREDILAIMEQAFYAPNVKRLKKRYEKNCRLLSKYPYLFRKDFVPFEELSLCFFPFDDGSYYLFDLTTGEFSPLFTPNDPVISRNFFRDLEKPVLADDVYSQHELEYLYDNVRKSEYVARENHIYLHYTDWAAFCAYLQVLDLRPVLDERKIVFLIEDEISQYPIDFKECFGIDYSQYPLRPVGIREVTRLIWHVQLSAHNGGDFFNEVFDSHPNLLYESSLFLDRTEEKVEENLKTIRELQRQNIPLGFEELGDESVAQRMNEVRDWTEKDVLVAMYLNNTENNRSLDPASRIAPALFFQPHFSCISSGLGHCYGNELMVNSDERDAIRSSKLFRGFKYIKTFAPMRRPTTSYAASMRFLCGRVDRDLCEKNQNFMDTNKIALITPGNSVVVSSMVRSYMADPDDALFKDSVIVRFEDAKLNPKATFGALAAFLDLPYTESMTYCSYDGKRDPETLKGNARGFDPVTVYRTYEEYANEDERRFVEYCWRDAYRFYGYDFHYYDGKPMTEEDARRLIDHFTTFESHYRTAWLRSCDYVGQLDLPPNLREEFDSKANDEALEGQLAECRDKALSLYRVLSKNPVFVNKDRKLLRMIPLLKPDPALLETELYH